MNSEFELIFKVILLKIILLEQSEIKVWIDCRCARNHKEHNHSQYALHETELTSMNSLFAGNFDKKSFQKNLLNQIELAITIESW